MANPKLERLERVKEQAMKKLSLFAAGTPEGERAYKAAWEASGAVSRFKERLMREGTLSDGTE